MRILMFAFVFLAFCLSSFGQIRLEGYITTQEATDAKEMPFVNVVLKNAEDSASVEFSTITDLRGYYTFESVPMKQYWLEVSFLGYQTISELIDVDFPSVGNSMELNYTLSVDSKLLNEVVVTANTIRKGIDKTTYLITPADVKSARFSMDLLEKIPALSINPLTQKIVAAKGNVKILIDGISSGEIDLKAIPPNKVARMDYYDVPPAKYTNYDVVVNVITKNLDDGFAAGATLQHAFTTGFANDDVFVKFNRGRHQFSADYTLNYRNYSDVNTLVKYAYPMEDNSVNRNENSVNPFGYNDHTIHLKYVNRVPDKSIFQVKLSPNMNFNHSLDNSDIEILTGKTSTYRTGSKTDSSKIFNPSVNLYFWKQLKNKQTITMDVLGNLFIARQSIRNREYNISDNQLELNDKMDLNNRKKSLIGELVYEKTTETGKLTFGNRLETYTMNSKVENSFDNKDYTSSYFADYLYGEYTGAFDKFTYRATLGLMYKQNNNSVNKYASWIFRPLLLFGYNINAQNTVRLLFTQIPEEPAISEQSDNVIFVSDNILKKGNPYLKNSLARAYMLNYGFTDKRFDLNLILAGATIRNNISSYYVKTNDYYLLTSLNDNNTQYGLVYSAAIKPFAGNLLTFKLNGEVTRYSVKNDIIGNFTHWYAPVQYEILLKSGKFAASYQGSIVSKDLSGTYLRKDENNSHFTLRYNYKDFSVWGNLLFAFSASKYLTETIPESLVAYSSFRNIYDNKNMFTLGVSYTFHSGKKYEDPEKKINNYDSDAGLFK
jgi:hypothetical protein